MTVAAVVLAAGASSRMGRPKALAQWRGRTFVEHVLESAACAGCDPVVVVEGATPLRGALPDGTAQWVTNPAWERGPLSSLQAGLTAVPDSSAVLVLTVDRPHVEPATLSMLVAAHDREPLAVWQPRHAGSRGHPILYPADLCAALAELAPEDSPRSLLALREVAARRRVVDVDDPGVLDNLDRPEDLNRLPP